MSLRKIKGGKAQLTFGEVVEPKRASGSAGGNELLLALNASDPRFAARKPRQAWISGEIQDIVKALELDPSVEEKFKSLIERDRASILNLDIENPKFNGKHIRVRVVESTEPDEYQAEHAEETCMKTAEGALLLTPEGEMVWSNTSIVLTKSMDEPVAHVFLPELITEGSEVHELQ